MAWKGFEGGGGWERKRAPQAESPAQAKARRRVFAPGALNPTCGCEVCVVQCGAKRSQGSCVGQAARVWKPVLSNPTHSAGRWEPTIVPEQSRSGKRAWAGTMAMTGL